jgi:hypothetical protein
VQMWHERIVGGPAGDGQPAPDGGQG